MSQKRTYINLINDFWERYPMEPISAPASMVYFYLLNRINRNRWQPVFISDVEIAEALNISRNHVPGYRQDLCDAGLILFAKIGFGRQAGTAYGIPGISAPKEAVNCTQKGTLTGGKCTQKGTSKKESAPKEAVNCTQKGTLTGGKCTQKGTSKKESAPKEAVNCTQKGTLTDFTPYYISNKTYIRPISTTTEDTREGAAVAVEVEAVEVEILEAVRTAETRTENYGRLQKKSAEQGAEVLNSFFDQSNQVALETLCMQNRITPTELRALAGRVIEDWTQEGTCHDTFNGAFDLRGAIKHLRHTIPIKAAAERRQQNNQTVKTRDEKRHDLMAGAINKLNQAIANQNRPKGNNNNPF